MMEAAFGQTNSIQVEEEKEERSERGARVRRVRVPGLISPSLLLAAPGFLGLASWVELTV